MCKLNYEYLETTRSRECVFLHKMSYVVAYLFWQLCCCMECLDCFLFYKYFTVSISFGNIFSNCLLIVSAEIIVNGYYLAIVRLLPYTIISDYALSYSHIL